MPIIFPAGEGQPGISTITYKELYRVVGTFSRALQGHGVQSGCRVVGYLPNCPAAIQAMLASAAIGATWSSTSPDFGVTVRTFIMVKCSTVLKPEF